MATTRNTISATMAHLIPCNGGSRFEFSHIFLDLIAGKTKATLEGQNINVRIRSNKQQNKIITLPDSFANDYIHQPIDNKLEQICFYDMTRCYKKGFNASPNVQINDEEENTYIHGCVKKYKFKETHPGLEFSHLIQLKFSCIPRVALPKGKLCPLNELDPKFTNPPQHVVGKREMYAKIALLMFIHSDN